jgi:uncharacterized protein (DUF1778 family)
MVRPKKAPEDRKTIVLRVLVTDEERQRFQEAAEREGRSLSDWLRRLGLDAVSERTARRKPRG